MAVPAAPRLDADTLARRLGGDRVNGVQVLAPGPGHSAADRSLSVKVDPTAPDGFLVNSFAGDDPIACRDHVRERCGLPAFEPRGQRTGDVHYFYHDADGRPFLRVTRTADKRFWQHRHVGGKWIKPSEAPLAEPIPYRLPELLAADPSHVVFVCEGEKDADRLAQLGFVATTNAGGAGKWTAAHARRLAGRQVVVLVDNDPAGREHAALVASSLRGVAAEVRILELPDLPPKGDVSDWLNAGGDPATLAKLAEATPLAADWSPAPTVEPATGPNLPPTEAPRFAPVCAHDVLQQVFPPRELVLGPWLPAKGLAMLAAPRGVGKTHVALGIAYAVATGGEFLRWRATSRRRVLYLDGEMPAVALQERLSRIVQRAAAEPEPGALAFLAADQCEFGLPDLSTLEGQAALRPCMEPFDLIVLDNLSTLCRSGRENEAESWGAVQGFLLELRRAGKSVLLVHHTGKGGQQRGTSKREDVLDSVLLLKRPDDYDPAEGARFTVHYDKARGFHGPEAEPFEAKLDRLTGEWRTDTATASRDAEIREMHECGKSVREIAKGLDLSKSAVQRALYRMREATP